MSKLEKLLGLALTAVSSAYVYTIYKSSKHCKKTKQIDDKILETCKGAQRLILLL